MGNPTAAECRRHFPRHVLRMLEASAEQQRRLKDGKHVSPPTRITHRQEPPPVKNGSQLASVPVDTVREFASSPLPK